MKKVQEQLRIDLTKIKLRLIITLAQDVAQGLYLLNKYHFSVFCVFFKKKTFFLCFAFNFPFCLYFCIFLQTNSKRRETAKTIQFGQTSPNHLLNSFPPSFRKLQNYFHRFKNRIVKSQQMYHSIHCSEYSFLFCLAM